MKKLNLLNKIYIFLLGAMIIATGIKVHNFHAGERYYYAASFTSPPTYPMYVQDARFITEGNSDNQVFIKRDNVNGGGNRWGVGDPESAEEQERLPSALIVKYASYREKAFYFDTIPLPAKVIDKIFAGSAQKNLNVELSSSGPREVPGLIFLIGLANNGNLVIWLQGREYERKLLTYHLKPIKPAENQFYLPKNYFDSFHIDTAKYNKMVRQKTDAGANYADSSTYYVEYYRDPI